MNLQIIKIQPLSSDVSPLTLRPPEKVEYQYSSIAIEDCGKYYYWAKGVSIKISQSDYDLIRQNSKLFYFSTAFKLHKKISKLLVEID